MVDNDLELEDNPRVLNESGWSEMHYFFERRLEFGLSSEQERAALRDSLHPETLARCESVRQSASAAGHADAFERAVNTCLKEGDCILLNNMGALVDMCSTRYFDYYVAGLNGNVDRHGYRVRDYGAATDEELNVARAVLRAVHALEDHTSYKYVDTYYHARVPHTAIISPLLRDLIERRPERVDQIISLLLERSLPVDFDSDITEIESLLSNELHPAVAEGVL